MPVTKLRVVALSVLATGLGGVVAGGLRLMDRRSPVVAVVGGAAVLSVALVLDAVGMARSVSNVACRTWRSSL